MQAQTIIFIGPQGSGKGTQVEHLVNHLKAQDAEADVIEIQTGKGFREIAAQEGYTATRIKDLLEHGSLVPDFLTQAIVVNQLIAHLKSNSHIIMDGFPRNVAQAAFVDDVLAFYLRDSVSIVYLDTPEEVVIERMLARGRSDDTKASIEERLRLYKEMTEPLIAHYEKQAQTKMIKVNGAQTVEEVQKEICTGLGI